MGLGSIRITLGSTAGVPFCWVCLYCFLDCFSNSKSESLDREPLTNNEECHASMTRIDSIPACFAPEYICMVGW